MNPLDFLPLIPLAFLALLWIDYRQTPWNIEHGMETNRAILALHRLWGQDGVTIWFGLCAIAALALFAITLILDKPGISVAIGLFAIGIESTYVRENFHRKR